MKAKSVAKPARRAAGLTIRASLEPRTDAGINPAADIFRQAKEISEPTAAEVFEPPNSPDGVSTAQMIESETQTIQADKTTFLTNGENALIEKEILPPQKMVEPAVAANQTASAATSDLVRFGGGQMRVVSLQPPRQRKFPKTTKKAAVRVTANSVAADKTSQLFERTKAEELYDLLHQLTIGASEPCASVRVRRSDLMAGTNIKTRITLDLNLKRLEENGLIKIESRPGEQEGNIYTVFELRVG